MAQYRNNLDVLGRRIFLDYVGMETDLIFTQNVPLPGFASFPLLEKPESRELLVSYCRALIDVGKTNQCGVILESPTWVANADRAAELGYSPDRLIEVNRDAIQAMVDARQRWGDLPTLVSGNIGPRADAYAPADQMTAEQAKSYHMAQIKVIAETEADLVSAFTMTYPAEPIGMALAARACEIPIVVSFTLETDGKLPTGVSLKDAISEVDAACDGYVEYFMINCAHPEHFANILTDELWVRRVKGVVANASRCSHAELDEAEVLDDGNPEELGLQIGEIRKKFPHINVIGGCCGTDMRHLKEIAQASQKLRL